MPDGPGLCPSVGADEIRWPTGDGRGQPLQERAGGGGVPPSGGLEVPGPVGLEPGMRQVPPTVRGERHTWLEREEGTLILEIPGAATGDIPPGRYRVRATVATGGVTIPVFDGELELTPSPGAATPLPTYGSFRDLTRLAEWVPQFQDLDHGKSGFAEARHAAREWIDNTLLVRARSRLLEQQRRFGPVSVSDPVPITAGVDHGPAGGPSVYADTTIRDQLQGIRGHLDADRLMVDETLKQIASKYALYIVLQSRVTADLGSETMGGYQAFADRLYRRAVAELYAYSARIDTSGDGSAEIEL